MSQLHLADEHALADLETYVARARSLDADGAIRLQAHGMTLAAYVGVLPGRGLMSEGAVIALRIMPLSESADVDVTVALASLADRFARKGGEAGATLAVPPTTVRVGWAAVAPPRSGWEPVGRIAVRDLKDVATQGIAEVARGAPEGSGGHAVATLRAGVWGRDTQTVPPIAAGAAFAAYALGFLGGDEARVFASGRWTRLSTQAGHVLVR